MIDTLEGLHLSEVEAYIVVDAVRKAGVDTVRPENTDVTIGHNDVAHAVVVTCDTSLTGSRPGMWSGPAHQASSLINRLRRLSPDGVAAVVEMVRGST